MGSSELGLPLEAGPSKPIVANESSTIEGMASKKFGFSPEADQLPLNGLLKTPFGASIVIGFLSVPKMALIWSVGFDN